MAMRWYVVHTFSGSEKKAMEALQQRVAQHGLEDRFGEILVPSEQVVDAKSKRKTTRNFFPGYMLVECELDNETWHVVKNTPRVTGFVGGARNPPPVPEEEVLRITRRLRKDDEPRPVVDFELGEEVRLTDGPYASMTGKVDEVNQARGKVRVVINMFGRPVSTELGFHQVEKLS